MRAAWEADAAGGRRAAAWGATVVVVGWSGEDDGYWGQDGDEEGGKMHGGCWCVVFWFGLVIYEIKI